MSSSRRVRLGLGAAATLIASTFVSRPDAADAQDPAGASTPPTFAAVAAIFGRACVHCHGGESAVEGLALDSHAGVLKGSGRGAVVVPGQPGKSALVGRLRGTIQPHMPFDGDPLPEAEIRLVEEWIRTGAKDAGPEAPARPEGPAAPTAPAAPAAPGSPAAPGTPTAPVVPAAPVAPGALTAPTKPEDAAGPAAPAAPAAPGAPSAPQGPVTWSTVAPILRAACVRCHQPKGIRGPAPEGLRFDGYDATVGTRERVSVIPGRPEASPLVRAVRGQVRTRMPLGAPALRPEAIALLERWVRDGARGDDGKAAPMPVGAEVRLFGVFDGASRLDAVPLGLDAATRLDGAPKAGTLIEARATVLADGSLRATRVRARAAADGADDGARPGGKEAGGGGGRGADDGAGDDHGGGRGRGGDDGDDAGDDHGRGRGRGGR